MSNSQPTKMWSGRFREPLDRTFEQWQRSFPYDWRLLPHEVAASQAHARALAAAGILSEDELQQMLAGLTRVGERLLNWSHRISATSGQIDYETSNDQIGAAILDIPASVSEPFEPDQVMHGLPGNTGQRHLTGEMKNDDVAAFRHDRFHKRVRVICR